MNLSDLHEDLRRRTDEALRRDVTLEDETARRSGEPTRPGDVFLFPETAEAAISWVVLGDAGDEGRLRVVPADTLSLVGSADVATAAEADVGPLSLRCGFGLELEPRRFDPHLRTGTISRDTLEAARAKHSALAAGGRPGSARERQVDRDPEYMDWQEDLDAAREALTRVEVPETPDPGGRVLAWRGRREPALRHSLALAASILVAVSLAGALAVEHGRRGELERRSEQTETELRQRLADLERRPLFQDQIEGNLPFAWLESQRSRGEATPLRVPADAPGFLLVLQLPSGEPDDAVYRLDVLDGASGEVLRSVAPLRRVSVSELTVVFPRGALSAGEVRLRLHRSDAQEVARYTLSLVEPGGEL